MHEFGLLVILYQMLLLIDVLNDARELSQVESSSCILPQRAMSSMKAIRVHEFGGPEVLKYDTGVPVPAIGARDVLVRVKAVGINPVETYIRLGQYARLPTLPFILGGDSAGVVEDIGSEVTDYKKGDRVFTFSRTNSGTYAEFTSAPVDHVQPLPEPLSFSQGASLGVPYLTAYRALITKANSRPGEFVLIHGASGGVGIAAVQFAKAYGMTVIGTAGTSEGLDLVRKAGAHHVFNHRENGYLDSLKAITEGKGIDVIIENAAHVNLGNDLTLLSMGGRVIVVGSRGPNEINPRNLMARESAVLGVMLFNASEKELKESLAAIQAGIKNGWLRPIVGKSFDLEKASECHQDIIHGKGALGKSVLTID